MKILALDTTGLVASAAIVDENKTIILIHHHSKASGTNKSSARGASAFIDACRMHYIIEKVEND